jgi:hypothetical protein
MNVYFSQIYIEVGISFPFSSDFQRWISRSVTDRIGTSPKFSTKYGEDWSIIFNVSAKQGIEQIEISGPARFPKDRNVEFTLFLPYGVIMAEEVPLRAALERLISGTRAVLDRLEIESEALQREEGVLIAKVLSDPQMFSARP